LNLNAGVQAEKEEKDENREAANELEGGKWEWKRHMRK
jgi:hypothetical protein